MTWLLLSCQLLDGECICLLANASESRNGRPRSQAMWEVTVCFPFLLGSDGARFPCVSRTLMEIVQSKHVVHLRERNWFVLGT